MFINSVESLEKNIFLYLDRDQSVGNTPSAVGKS